MHKDLELKLLQKKAHLLSDAPPLVGEFITSIETATTLKTQIAYLGDLSFSVFS